MTSTLLLCLFCVRSHRSTYQVAKKIEELRPACELYLYAFQTKYKKATRITIGGPYIFASTTNGSELPNLQNSKFQIPGFLLDELLLLNRLFFLGKSIIMS